MFYKYKLSYYDSYKNEECSDEGLVWGKSYGSAANKIAEDYDEASIIDIYLQGLLADGVNCINKEEIDYAFKVN